jgi:hypothetical protein
MVDWIPYSWWIASLTKQKKKTFRHVENFKKKNSQRKLSTKMKHLWEYSILFYLLKWNLQN